jgi:hypothetical protein
MEPQHIPVHKEQMGFIFKPLYISKGTQSSTWTAIHRELDETRSWRMQ